MQMTAAQGRGISPVPLFRISSNSQPTMLLARLALLLLSTPLLASSLSAAGASPSPAAAPMTENPLLKESSLDFHYPPFDKIKDGHFAPAYEQGMAEQLKEIQPIASNTEPPTFENTIVAMEKTGELLTRVDHIFSSLSSANTNPALQKIETEMARSSNGSRPFTMTARSLASMTNRSGSSSVTT
jgi:peptidyl-dipeptidase Dcp